MNKKILIIADLHLQDDLKIFENFCKKIAVNADELYILGDLFDVYLGDNLIKDYYSVVVSILKKLKKTTNIFIMRGNRDFLIGNDFAKKSGATIINEPYILGDYVLIHGDSLVTDDKSYQIFKKIIQNPISKFIIVSLPKKLRYSFAKKIKQKSKMFKQNKSLRIMDVNLLACDRFMQDYPNFDLIHGHTHKLNTHKYKKFTRFVLGDWSKNNANAIQITDQITRVNFQI